MSTNTEMQHTSVPSNKPRDHCTGCGMTKRRKRTNRHKQHRESVAQQGRTSMKHLGKGVPSDSEDEEDDRDGLLSTQLQLEMLETSVGSLQAKLAAMQTERDNALRQCETLEKQVENYQNELKPTQAVVQQVMEYKNSRAACGRLLSDMVRLLGIFHKIAKSLGFSSMVDFTIYGSAVRKLFEFIAAPNTIKGSDFGSYPRDIDVKAALEPNQFVLFHQILKALVTKRLGLLEGMQIAVAEVSDVEKLRNESRRTTTTKFSLVLHDKSVQKVVMVDVCLADGNKVNDFNVNGLILTRDGIKSCIDTPFLDVVTSILDKEAIPLNRDYAFRGSLPREEDLSMLLRSLKLGEYKIPEMPILSWGEDIIFKEEEALCLTMEGCNCTTERKISFKALSYYIQNGRDMNCPMCRGRFSAIGRQPPKVKPAEEEVSNLFLLPDKEVVQEYTKRSERELETYLSVTKDAITTEEDPDERPFTLDGVPVMLDGKEVKHGHISDTLGVVRGDHRVQPPPGGLWRDAIPTGCRCSRCTGRSGAAYDYY